MPEIQRIPVFEHGRIIAHILVSISDNHVTAVACIGKWIAP